VNARILAAAALVAAAATGPGCHERRAPSAPEGDPRVVGAYRGIIDSGQGKARKFRMLLWAGLPDRLHAEVSPPVGGPAVIVDAGGGRLSVALVRERTAYVGPASVAAIGAVTGVSVSLEDLVGWIVLGAEAEGGDVRVTRRPERGPGLPRELEIRAGGKTLRIELRETWSAASLGERTGTGESPPGIVERPIEELPVLETGRDDTDPVEDR
jgi:hypothetical protein